MQSAVVTRPYSLGDNSKNIGMDIDNLFRIAVGRLNINPFEFWELTPYELLAIVDIRSEQQTEKRQELLFLAWHIEAFARQKRLSALKKVLKDSGIKKKANRLSTEQLMRIAQSKGLVIPKKYCML